MSEAQKIAAVAVVAWFGGTICWTTAQWFENRYRSKPGDPFWAPVWWIALTWPFWLFAIAVDAPFWPWGGSSRWWEQRPSSGSEPPLRSPKGRAPHGGARGQT